MTKKDEACAMKERETQMSNDKLAYACVRTWCEGNKNKTMSNSVDM